MAESAPVMKRVHVVPDISDPRFVWLRLDRIVLLGLLLVLMAIVLTMVWASLHNARSDNTIAREVALLRQDLTSTQRIINNANDISYANTELLRCAFLIQPDVEKTEEVLDECIERARFPAREGK